MIYSDEAEQDVLERMFDGNSSSSSNSEGCDDGGILKER